MIWMKASLSCCLPWMARILRWHRGWSWSFTVLTPERPHGISYALVLRRKDGGRPLVRFDNAHAVDEGGRGYRRKRAVYDHWHRTEKDEGRPYNFTTVAQLLDDFWKEVRRALNEKGIPNDL